MRHFPLAVIDRLDQEFAVYRMQEGGAGATVAERPAPHIGLHDCDLGSAIIGIAARHDIGIGFQARGHHRVDIVGNGKAAVEAVTGGGRKRRYDVVLMDLHMPVMDGLDAIAAIRRYEEEVGVPPVPIMVLSADSQEKTRHAVLAHGASGFVTKPLDPEALVNAVEGQVAA